MDELSTSKLVSFFYLIDSLEREDFKYGTYLLFRKAESFKKMVLKCSVSHVTEKRRLIGSDVTIRIGRLPAGSGQ